MGESIVYAIKIGLAIAIAGVFAAAIVVLVSGLFSLVLSSIVGEVLSIISVCLPFSPVPVFSAIQLSMGAILAFLVAKKIYNLCSDALVAS